MRKNKVGKIKSKRKTLEISDKPSKVIEIINFVKSSNPAAHQVHETVVENNSTLVPQFAYGGNTLNSKLSKRL